MNKGKLFLIPCIIAEGTGDLVIPPHVRSIVPNLKYFLVENVRSARRFISGLKAGIVIEDLNFSVLDKNTNPKDLGELMKPLLTGYDIGILSESGCPGVADPGAIAVRWAHEQAIQVIPLVGPSSIILALMASGLNGQQFCFHGYLPVQSGEVTKMIKELERESQVKKQTQIFIETPYRNNSLFNALLQSLKPSTQLCVAIDLTGSSESIKTYSVQYWRTLKTDWPKEPALFLFLAG